MPDVVITHRYTREVRAGATDRDELTPLTFTIGVTFPARACTDSDLAATYDKAWEQCRFWLDAYLAGRDLSRVFDFPPTPPHLAWYLLRVFSQFSPHLGLVDVTLDGECATAHADSAVLAVHP